MNNSELSELYQEVILDHNKNPQNFGKLEHFSHHAVGHNPLCGDDIELFIETEDGVIQEIKFIGAGCAISKASASIMTTILKGKTVIAAKKLFEDFHKAITSDPNASYEELNLGKLAVFCGVREFPARVKCASLAWHTLINALDNTQEKASTE
ncbi:Zinc-dependent sulfurtransferase SufU [bioreactor metagenome]|uniref:Zinc-dependent sulfurtransferase SufU n=1 Tax=bioreactor metagenome TaxID=1076179 RepID=A0A645H6S8_9ZZZZ